MAENEVWLNARAATELGFAQGDKAVLVNQDNVRSLPVSVKVTQRIRPDCVYMVHGFGHTSPYLHFAYHRGASDMQLITRQKTDPVCGGTGMRVNFVRLERATV